MRWCAGRGILNAAPFRANPLPPPPPPLLPMLLLPMLLLPLPLLPPLLLPPNQPPLPPQLLSICRPNPNPARSGHG